MFHFFCLFLSAFIFLDCKSMGEAPSSDNKPIEDIFDLIEGKKIYKLEALIKGSPQILKEHHKNGYYALHVASERGFIDAVDLMLDSDAVDIDQRSFYGERALTIASKKGNLQLVVNLVNRGSDPYEKDTIGRAPIAYAIIGGYKDIVNYFLSQSLDVKKFFEDQYVWLNGRERRTNNLLTLACCNGHKEITRSLLNAGAPTRIDDSYDVRPLQILAKKGNIEIVELLLNHGAAVNDYGKVDGPFGDEDEPTPLISAISAGDENMVKLFLDYGADIKKVYCGKNAREYARSLQKVYVAGPYNRIYTLIKTHKIDTADINVKISSEGDRCFVACAENGDC